MLNILQENLGGFFVKARRNSRVYFNLFKAFLGLTILLNIFIGPHHPHFIIDHLPGFFAAFGLIATFLLGRISKGSAHMFLGKDEDYYERD
ncbi:MAG: hypothetical protein ACLFP9_00145 [Desulfonatronovibrio sp.]